jgi:hypothetical protein
MYQQHCGLGGGGHSLTSMRKESRIFSYFPYGQIYICRFNTPTEKHSKVLENRFPQHISKPTKRQQLFPDIVVD